MSKRSVVMMQCMMIAAVHTIVAAYTVKLPLCFMSKSQEFFGESASYSTVTDSVSWWPLFFS